MVSRPTSQVELSRTGCHSSTIFEPTHIRFTNYTPYERLRIAINLQYPCIIEPDSLAQASFAFHEKPKSLHPLLEEANAHFTHLFIFLHCLYVFTCITRKHRTRKPPFPTAFVTGETDIPSFSSLVSCEHILTPSLPSLLPRVFHALATQYPSAPRTCLSLAITPLAFNTRRRFHKFILSTTNHQSFELQAMRRRWRNR